MTRAKLRQPHWQITIGYNVLAKNFHMTGQLIGFKAKILGLLGFAPFFLHFKETYVLCIFANGQIFPIACDQPAVGF